MFKRVDIFIQLHKMDNENYEQNEKNSSIKIERTASNKWVFSVKLYFGIEEDENAILERIKKIYDKLEETYKND